MILKIVSQVKSWFSRKRKAPVIEKKLKVPATLETAAALKTKKNTLDKAKDITIL